jgi:hypothetical protein
MAWFGTLMCLLIFLEDDVSETFYVLFVNVGIY